MEKSDVYRELAKKVGMEGSPTVARVWQLLCTEEEAELVDALPGTAEEMAGRFGKELAVMQDILESLFQRGAIFENVKDGKVIYRAPRHIIQFHDATVLWPKVSREILAVWTEFHHQEYHQIPAAITQFKMPSMMRVIPINEGIAAKGEVLPYEDAVRMVESATRLAVTNCTCRMLLKKCDKPLEVCLQLNKGADYNIRRGSGREITVAEAKEILKKAERAGLVHATENRAVVGTTLCNCCECCCITLPFMRSAATSGVLSPSRFRAAIDANACIGCGLCVDICPMEAITQTEEFHSAVDEAKCIGCGLCANECPSTAITLEKVRERDFIPG
jgi:formate hydrogenlyase subunit 6/NADH:ubiquinone oxidoreductase subunit I